MAYCVENQRFSQCYFYMCETIFFELNCICLDKYKAFLLNSSKPEKLLTRTRNIDILTYDALEHMTLSRAAPRVLDIVLCCTRTHDTVL